MLPIDQKYRSALPIVGVNMKKRDIKVVKRGESAVVPEVPELPVPKQKSPADQEREMVDSVKGWITEHAESKVSPSNNKRSKSKKGRF